MDRITIPFKIQHWFKERISEHKPELEEGSVEYNKFWDSCVDGLVRHLSEQIPNKDSLTSSELITEIQKKLDLWVVPQYDDMPTDAVVIPQTINNYAREQVLSETPDVDEGSDEYKTAFTNKLNEVMSSIASANPYDPETMTNSEYDMLLVQKMNEWQPPS